MSERQLPRIEDLFRFMLKSRASDLHISAGSPPMLRHDGDVKSLSGVPTLTAADTETMLWPITPERNREEFRRRHDTDFAYEIPGVARYRCNLFLDRKGMGGVFRIIPTTILTAEEMELSPEILALCHLPKGLVLVTGPTGSGKSTTLAALVDYINRTRSDHIVTIEDPIEFVHENKRCLINQRQVGEHTDSFKQALRAALREDPDIVLVGEMRDLETVAIAIETAETGHLVFGTLHTSSAPSTVDRIIDQFPADRQAQIRVMLSDSLKGVISQTLCRRIGGGRVPAMEVLIAIPAVANLIREGKVFQIPSIMQTGKRHGMRLMNDSLLDLVKRGVVDPQEAWSRALDKAGLVGMLNRADIETPWLAGEGAKGEA
ncbi:MAG: type IV pilus twitching motility protein PilT [Acidobacteriota bacterium]